MRPMTDQWHHESLVVPVFPRGGGANLPGGGGGGATYNFIKGCQKLYEIERILPCRSATVSVGYMGTLL